MKGDKVELHTYQEWRDLGYQVAFGSKSVGRDARGALFSQDQVVEHDPALRNIPRDYQADMVPSQDELY